MLGNTSALLGLSCLQHRTRNRLLGLTTAHACAPPWRAPLQSLPPSRPLRWETPVPLIDISWPTRTPDPGNMHAEPGDAVPLRVIVPNQRVFGTRHFPHPFNSKKAAADFVDRDSPAIFYLFPMVSQAGTKLPGLTHIDRQTTAKQNVYTRLTRSFGRKQGVFRTGLQCGDQLVLIGLIDIELESVAVAHHGT